MGSAFGGLDWAVLGAFALLLVGIVWWVARQKEKDTADYFLAGRDAGWLVIGASIFASNIGSEHLVGLSSSGFQNGMTYAHYELHSWVIIVLAWVFVPYYLRAQIFTTPEFLDRRYSPATRTFFSFISLVAYVLTKVSVTVFAGGIAIKNIFGLETLHIAGMNLDFFWVSAIALVVITGVYTVIGGMKAVLWTSALQTPVMLVGSLFLLIIGLQMLGDGNVTQGFKAMEEINGDRMSLWRPLDDPDMPWLAIALGSPIVGLWYWCTDQYIVQRVLSGRDMKQARRGAFFGAYLKILPVFIFLVPGIIAYALVQKGMLTLPLDPKTGEPISNASFPVMVRELLPQGIKGLVLGGAVAALMSSLASLFNSTATLFTVDFYERLVPNKSQSHYVYVGRIATATVVLLGIAWVPIIPRLGESLYQSLQTVQGYIAPAITAVFFLGIFSGFFTPAAGFWGLALGFLGGMFRLVLDLVAPLREAHPFLTQLASIHWLYYAFGLFVFTIVVMVLLSLVTKKKTAAELEGLTYASITPAQRQEVRESYGTWDYIHTFVILGVIAAVYVYFW